MAGLTARVAALDGADRSASSAAAKLAKLDEQVRPRLAARPAMRTVRSSRQCAEVSSTRRAALECEAAPAQTSRLGAARPAAARRAPQVVQLEAAVRVAVAERQHMEQRLRAASDDAAAEAAAASRAAEGLRSALAAREGALRAAKAEAEESRHEAEGLRAQVDGLTRAKVCGRGRVLAARCWARPGCELRTGVAGCAR